MYAKCGDLVKVEQVFTELPTKSIVAWNARITGCIQCGQAYDAIKWIILVHLMCLCSIRFLDHSPPPFVVSSNALFADLAQNWIY